VTVELNQRADGAADTFAAPTGAWTVLAEPADADRDAARVWSMRRVVVQLVVAVLLVVAVVGIVGALVTRRLAEQQGVHDSAQLTDVLAESTVQPALTDAVATHPTSGGALDRAVRRGVLSATLIRVKIWDRNGQIVYSDEPRLVGRTFTLDDEAQESFAGRRTQADVSNLKAPENRFEQTKGQLLEVYRPVWTPNGTPLLFEAYYRYDVVTSRASALWRAFSGIMLSSLAAVFVLLMPVAWALVQRGRRAQREREAAMQRAVDASQEERRRIAGTLHDGVVQQLAAASFAVSGDAERAARDGAPELAASLRETAGTVRATMAGMRSLLVDLYPPSLRSGGLAPALRDLAGSVSGTDAHVDLVIDSALAEELDPDVQESVYRVAQECLRNAAKHAAARHIEVRLAPHERLARLEVSDDGVGFDPAAALRERAPGHLGLELLADAARRVGGRLEVSSAPSRGAAFRLDVPR
jgi:two-component system NarL family sensor kinase